MKSEIESSRWGVKAYPLGFHVKQAGADAKLIQHGPLGVAYHRRHPISTVPVARITAHTTVPGFSKNSLKFKINPFIVKKKIKSVEEIYLKNCFEHKK
jgi:hypothetical protein